MFDLSSKEEKYGKKSFKQRSFFLLSILLLFAFISLFQIIKLTVLDNNIYVTESDQNRIIFSPIFPARGLVKLSDGQLITENVVSNDIWMKENTKKKCVTDVTNGTLYCIGEYGIAFSINKKNLNFRSSSIWNMTDQSDAITVSYGTCDKF